MQSLAIITLCILAAVLYGVGHDQITARLCVEYFTIGHPPIFATRDPTLLGLAWGIVGTWWVGLILGVPLALAARAGRRPKRGVLSLIRPIGVLLTVMAVCACVAGITGWVLADRGLVILVEPLASRIPQAKRVAFIANIWAHTASYLAGLAGGLVIIVRAWRSRGHSQRKMSPPLAPFTGPIGEL